MKMGNKICKFFFFFCCIVGIFSCSKDNEKPEIVTVSRTPDYLSVDEVLDILGTNRRKAYLIMILQVSVLKMYMQQKAILVIL